MGAIGLGLAAIGRPQYINIRAEGPQDDFSPETFRHQGLEMLDAAYDMGVRFFDASPGYGMAESFLVEWLIGKCDPAITVATKWGMRYLAEFNPKATVHEAKEHTRERLDAQWEFSRQLLPQLKMYQIHSATQDTGVLDNKEVLRRLYQIGKEHNLTIGLSTTGADQVEVLEKAMGIEIEGEPLFGSFQSTYNIMEQSIFRLKTSLEKEGRQLILKESLANGRLIPTTSYSHNSGLYRELERLARHYGVGPDAVAIRFCMDSFPNAVCLSGAGTAAQLRSNLAAKELSLAYHEMELLASYASDPISYWEERKLLPWQ